MAKFKVGEVVAVKLGKSTNTTFHITQITETTCFAGTQTRYEGRLWQEIDPKDKRRMCMLKLNSFEEIELESK